MGGTITGQKRTEEKQGTHTHTNAHAHSTEARRKEKKGEVESESECVERIKRVTKEQEVEKKPSTRVTEDIR